MSDTTGGKSGTLMWVFGGCIGLFFFGGCVLSFGINIFSGLFDPGVGYAVPTAPVGTTTGQGAARGGPILPRLGPAPGSRQEPPPSIQISARIVETTGTLPLSEGDRCEFSVVRRERAGGDFWCRAQVMCGEQLLYGAANTGYFDCVFEPPIVRGEDTGSTAVNTDPEFAIDTGTGVLTLADDSSGAFGEFTLRAEIESPAPSREGVEGNQENGGDDDANRVPQVRTGQLSVQGALSHVVVRRVVRRHHSEVSRCYEAQLDANPELAGRVNVRFTISGTGTVESASVQDSTAENDALHTCITSAVQRWTFPAPDGGAQVVVTYPFILRTVS